MQRRHVVAISVLAQGHDATAFARLAQRARLRNPALGVSGAMLFDGQRCCHWLHGTPEAVDLALAQCAQDPYHEQLKVVLHASLPPTPWDDGWRAGYVDTESIDAWLDACGQDGDAAIAALTKMLAFADLDAPAPAPPAGSSNV